MKRKIISKKEDFIDYSGHVEVKLLRDRKVISSYKYHNKGRGKLFKFLCNALAGNYIERERPCQIKLFYYQKADTTDTNTKVLPNNFNWEELGDNDLTAASTFINYDTAPVLIKDENNYKVTYHFRIPFTQICNSSIYIVGLYPINVISDKDDASAYYLFIDTENNNWKPINIKDSAGNFSLVIDWTLMLENKN